MSPAAVSSSWTQVAVAGQFCSSRQPPIACPFGKARWRRGIDSLLMIGVGKAEALYEKENPRYVVSSLQVKEWDGLALY